ncbi:bifunctional 2-polyprenyl-6-hydroxyphenol methylase/3-demethylubiquinol 3-O-methyltransferase UbiG [Pedobacter sp. SYSU D00535]|uniref:class I SAM-dependent methyltransferase n=1 Tax=Pedobacter sp. SYSU D00535 TaxID=2810308 RepID=UPI001A962829|nr:class I SAM-dependent methyltransferase [Pedobacter sp. SYSU D00535]
MKVRKPASRKDLSIRKEFRVLDIGGGHNPHPRANVVVDKYINDNTHRGRDIRVLHNQEFIHADGEHLPFKDKEFDYVICCHVLEHVENPEQFVAEQSRVAPRGYIETPSLLGEFLAPKESHKWVLQEIDNKIVLYEKEKIDFRPQYDFGDLFLYYLPKISVGYKIIERTQPDLFTLRHEWKDNIEILVNPDSSYYREFFTKPWDEKFYDKVFQPRSLGQEGLAALSAIVEITGSVFKSKILKRS